MTHAAEDPARARGDAAGTGRAPWRRIAAAPAIATLTIAVLAGCGSAAEPAGAPGADAPAATAPAAPPPSAAPATPSPEEPEEPEEPAAAAPLPASAPTRVEIDALGVRQEIVGLGLADDGTMEVPTGPDPVGWYEPGPTPGEAGPAVLAGHLTWNGADGVFRHLDGLVPGDEIRVTRADGSTALFAVTGVERYAKDAFPTARVYANTPGPELRLITCAGDLDTASGDYTDNVVAYARLVA